LSTHRCHPKRSSRYRSTLRRVRCVCARRTLQRHGAPSIRLGVVDCTVSEGFSVIPTPNDEFFASPCDRLREPGARCTVLLRSVPRNFVRRSTARPLTPADSHHPSACRRPRPEVPRPEHYVTLVGMLKRVC
jgi:hypothetical protein